MHYTYNREKVEKLCYKLLPLFLSLVCIISFFFVLQPLPVRLRPSPSEHLHYKPKSIVHKRFFHFLSNILTFLSHLIV